MSAEGTAAQSAADGVQVSRYAAFSAEPSGGNPAGVVLDAGTLDDVTMLAVARRVGYSETAFVTGNVAPGRYRLRYFSPVAEVAFCGHATVATAVALTERSGAGHLVFDTLAGEVRARTVTGDGPPRATLTSVASRCRPATDDEVEPALRAVRWSRADLDPTLPPAVAFAGNDHLVLAVRSRRRLAALDYDFEALGRLMRRHGWTTAHLVCREPADDLRFHARDPFPVGGVVEDPATGAAAAAFGGYLRWLGLIREPRHVRLRQGEDMGRPSDLLVEVHPDDPRIRVSGQAVAIPERA